MKRILSTNTGTEYVTTGKDVYEIFDKLLEDYDEDILEYLKSLYYDWWVEADNWYEELNLNKDTLKEFKDNATLKQMERAITTTDENYGHVELEQRND